MSEARRTALRGALVSVEQAIRETDRAQHRGGHRHLRKQGYAAWRSGGHWIACARLGGRLRVVGRAASQADALALAYRRAES